jgi:hypothetical protein
MARSNEIAQHCHQTLMIIRLAFSITSSKTIRTGFDKLHQILRREVHAVGVLVHQF